MSNNEKVGIFKEDDGYHFAADAVECAEMFVVCVSQLYRWGLSRDDICGILDNAIASLGRGEIEPEPRMKLV